jgi:uncharacterized protein
MTHLTLSAVYIYPIKSLAGIAVPHWLVTDTGFEHDRKMMLVDADRQFLSQRSLPKMALIKTAIVDDWLIVSAPDRANLTLPLQPKSGTIVNCTIWHDQVDAWAFSPEAGAWFSDFLQMPCQLVYQPDHTIRKVSPEYAKPEDQVSFADGFPFLVVSEASLNELNTQMAVEVTMQRFRPNLVIAGCESYAEDFWREITIGSIEFRLPKPCSRCSVPTINPETAQTEKEPLTTLNKLRKVNSKVYFGQNALHNNCGLLTVGDPVNITKMGSQQPPL